MNTYSTHTYMDAYIHLLKVIIDILYKGSLFLFLSY